MILKNENIIQNYGETEVLNVANNGKMSATIIIDDIILVNGKQIENSSEEYPVLRFRDVTYLPLTWRFAVEEFGWEYSYSQEYGISICSH